MRHTVAVVLVASLSACSFQAKDSSTAEQGNAPTDSAFAALQDRGKAQMGVDQYTSSHIFESLPDGGRIVLQRDVPDSAGTATIRTHLQHIAERFADGDFTIPGLVHDQVVPGTPEMTQLRALIRYAFDTLPRGGQVRITTRDSVAIVAVHEFLEFQRTDHRVGVHRH